MTPAEAARFIDLWTQGLEQTALAQALGIPRGTVSSRAMVLVAQGKIPHSTGFSGNALDPL